MNNTTMHSVTVWRAATLKTEFFFVIIFLRVISQLSPNYKPISGFQDFLPEQIP